MFLFIIFKPFICSLFINNFSFDNILSIWLFNSIFYIWFLYNIPINILINLFLINPSFTLIFLCIFFINFIIFLLIYLKILIIKQHRRINNFTYILIHNIFIIFTIKCTFYWIIKIVYLCCVDIWLIIMTNRVKMMFINKKWILSECCVKSYVW